MTASADTMEVVHSAPSARAAVTSGPRKAAILMILLGDEAASEICKHLEDHDVRRLTQEIAEIGAVSPEAAFGVLQEYSRLTATQEYVAQGGIDYASQLLVKAFGAQSAKQLLDQVAEIQEASSANLDSLQKADPSQLVRLVEGEHPQTVALILAHLGSKAASSLLLLLPEHLRAESIRRLAAMRQFSPEMVKKISLVLHKRISGLTKENRQAYGGISAAAEMLNRITQDRSKDILDSIDKSDTALAASIRQEMFTFKDLLSVPEASIREILGQAEKKAMSLALKGSPAELRDKFFQCMSSRAVEMMKEDLDALGPVRASQIQQAQQEVVTMARKLEAEGKIVLKAAAEDDYVT